MTILMLFDKEMDVFYINNTANNYEIDMASGFGNIFGLVYFDL